MLSATGKIGLGASDMGDRTRGDKKPRNKDMATKPDLGNAARPEVGHRPDGVIGTRRRGSRRCPLSRRWSLLERARGDAPEPRSTDAGAHGYALSVIVPTFNEEANVAILIDRVGAALLADGESGRRRSGRVSCPAVRLSLFPAVA